MNWLLGWFWELANTKAGQQQEKAPEEFNGALGEMAEIARHCNPCVRNGPGRIGAGDGIRTHDPNLGKVVLYP